MANNGNDSIKGGIVTGPLWQFAVLEKVGDNRYHYHVSMTMDALSYEKLQQIYINLQAVKAAILLQN